MRPPRRRPWLRALLTLALLSACDCREKTEEERLREQVDTTKVHLWVATKVAVTKAQSDDPDVQKARRQLMAVIAAYHAARSGEAPGEAPTLSASEAVDLAVALWELRATGARIVREDSEDELDPVLPVLLAQRGVSDELLAQLDANTEHALLMIGLFALKLHPKSPSPVPTEILLYEAMHVDADELALPGLADPTRAVRSYLYAQSDYCDLAQDDAEALDEGETQELAELLAAVGGAELPPTDLQRTAGAIRGIAHGSTALCYLNREDEDAAQEELEAFVESAEQGGAPPEDLAMIRAYLAYREDDLAETRRQLALAKGSELLDDQEREQIDGLIAQLDREESGALDGVFDKAFLGSAFLKVAWHEAEKAGLFDALAEAPLFHGVRDFVQGATGAVSGAAEATRGAEEAAEEGAEAALDEGRSLFDRLLGD